MGEGRRPETVAAADEDPHPEITLREISAWSPAILAAVAAGFVLYAAREVMLPVVAAFVVGVMLGPAARRLEALHVPRPIVALLLVASVTLATSSSATSGRGTCSASSLRAAGPSMTPTTKAATTGSMTSRAA